MPTIGERINPLQFSRGYENDPLNEYAHDFKECAQRILKEHGVDVFMNPAQSVMIEGAMDELHDFFVNNSCDTKGMTPKQLQEHMDEMEALFQNDRQAVLEYAPASQFNPVIGMSFPIHKNILMNTIFDKGVITKMVANSPKFTLSMETRTLVTPDGQEIDMWKEQNKMTAAIDATAPMIYVPMALPEVETTDVLKDYMHATNSFDNLSIECHVSHVLVSGAAVKAGEPYVVFTPPVAATESAPAVPAKFEDKVAAADTEGVCIWLEVRAPFTPYYGEYDRAMMSPINKEYVIKNATESAPAQKAVIKDVLSGYMKKNKFMIQSTGAVMAVKLAARIDTSTAMLPTCQVKWGVKTDTVEIPNAIPINTAVSPEEVKDIGALYNTNQLTKIMAMIKLVLGNYKDDKIKEALDDSFRRMPENQKIARTIDFLPRQGYYSDHIDWRNKTFMDALDSYVTVLLQVLNDPNMVVTVVGRSDIIRKLTPTDYTYQSPSNIGPVELDFVKTVVTSDKRTYQFISSDKLRGNNNLIILLNPRNTDRIIYRIYDYQMYVSNEIRNAQLYTLPSIHAFERWKFVEYQPVQGRIQILHPSGLADHEPNTDPIGTTAMNDYDVTP